MKTSTSSAAGTGSPIPPSILDMPRRGFLTRLAALPMVGGSVALLGRPTAVAQPATPDLIEAYKTWLDLERRYLSWQMATDPFFVARYGCHVDGSDRGTLARAISRHSVYVGRSGSYHGPRDQPYSRAALVMSTVGCDWHDDEDLLGLRRA